jgi:hypothetical protein
MESLTFAVLGNFIMDEQILTRFYVQCAPNITLDNRLEETVIFKGNTFFAHPGPSLGTLHVHVASILEETLSNHI